METSIYQLVAFYGLALTILGAATLVVFMRNIVHSVLFLALTFVAMAGLFLTLDAEFIAAIQVLVYAGAVCIMVVFGIMLIQRNDMKATNLFNRNTFVGAGLVAVTVAMCAVFAGRTAWVDMVAADAVPDNTVGIIGRLLLSKYVIPFEVAAILLLVALVGAIVLAKDEEVKTDADN